MKSNRIREYTAEKDANLRILIDFSVPDTLK